MSETKIKAKLTNDKENQKTIPVKLFKITYIPDVMDKKGWVMSARFMRKWFYDPYYEMSLNEKLNKIDMKKIDGIHIVDDLDFEWLYTSSKRVGPVIDNYVSNLAYVREYNGYLGRIEGITNQLSNGLIAIIKRLERLGVVDVKSKVIHNKILDFSSLSAIDLDKTSQFNYFPIGSTLWEKATDELDDVYGALGSFIVKIAFLNMIVAKDKNGFFRIEINKIGLYVRDTYEFMNDGDDQPLGYWGGDNVIKPGIISELMKKSVINKDGNDYYRVTNSSFVQYRNKCQEEKSDTTGDFFVFSTVKEISVDIVMHLSSIDLEEYAARSPRDV